MVTLKSKKDLEKMRRAGRLVGECHALVQAAIKPGVTTGELLGLPDPTWTVEGGFDRVSKMAITPRGAETASRGQCSAPIGAPDSGW